jgi:hypothetical protein
LQKAVISRWAFLKPRSEYPVFGKVIGYTAVFSPRLPFWFHNSFSRVLKVRLQDSANGCRIEGKFQLHPLVLVFMVVWFGVIALFVLVALASAIRHPAQSGIDVYFMFLAPLCMLCFGYLLVRFGVWISSFYEPRVTELVAHVTNGRVLEPVMSAEVRANDGWPLGPRR